MNFKDYFSNQAEDYVRYRPSYPAALFEYLGSLTVEHGLAWDCATGNGQVAVDLTPYFDRVYATDASAAQISHAIAHPQIEYRVAPAASSDLADRSVDLVTVGIAIHWFDRQRFYREVKRVLKPNGVIAVWCYGVFDIKSPIPQIDRLLDLTSQIDKLITPYWSPEIQLIADRYQTLDFPFPESSPPQFIMRENWQIDRIIGYYYSFSATQKYMQDCGSIELQSIVDRLLDLAPDLPPTIPIEWEMYLRVGRN